MPLCPQDQSQAGQAHGIRIGVRRSEVPAVSSGAGNDPGHDPRMETMTAQRIQTHASIDTSDLAASVAFYRTLLGAGPALERPDYARFDLFDPALVLGLNTVERLAPPARGPIEHLGVRFFDEAALDAARERLVRSGFALEEEPDTECCYSRLSRFWTTDPSGVRWEVFVAREVVVDAPSRAATSSSCCEPGCCATIES